MPENKITKIIIECSPEIDKPEEVIFNQFKEWCHLGLNRFKIVIEGTELKYEHEWIKNGTENSN